MASSSVDPSTCKSHYFMAQNDKERDSWIEAISRSKSVNSTLCISYVVMTCFQLWLALWMGGGGA